MLAATASDGFFIIPLLIYLAVIFLTIYFMVKIIKFTNEKVKLDRARNEKLDELIKLFSEGKRME